MHCREIVPLLKWAKNKNCTSFIMLIKVLLHVKPGNCLRNMVLGDMNFIKANVRQQQMFPFALKLLISKNYDA